MARKRVERYHDQATALAAARKYCAKNWSSTFGIKDGPLSNWSPALEQWFGESPGVQKLELAAVDALKQVQAALTAIERFEEIRKSAQPLRPLLATSFLKRWLMKHAVDDLRALEQFSFRSLALTRRQLVIQRSRSTYPQFFGPLRKALKSVEWTDHRLATVSILIGVETTIPRAKLSAGVTAAQVVGIEMQHMHQAIGDFEKKSGIAEALKNAFKTRP
jgi:hypothetical protein